MLKISVIIPTRDRPKDLADLLLSISNQSHSPLEVIIVDDSPLTSAITTVNLFSSTFASLNCKLKYVKGSCDGLPAARNLGVLCAEGDTILFLDDDTLLDSNAIFILATFFEDNPSALGVQPKIISLTKKTESRLARRFEDAFYRALMLDYDTMDKLAVRRSGSSVFPRDLTKVIQVQRLSGCCCYKKVVFNKLSFDTNLKRWGLLEDLDFSYRVYKTNPEALFATPSTRIIHKESETARLPTKTQIYMSVVYWFYVFFKDIFQGSVLNLIAFMWALSGNLFATLTRLIVGRKTKKDWWGFIYLAISYFYAFKHLREIMRRNLDFFNKQLKD